MKSGTNRPSRSRIFGSPTFQLRRQIRIGSFSHPGSFAAAGWYRIREIPPARRAAHTLAVNLLAPGQNPEILSGRLADDRPAVIGCAVQNPIIAFERLEERDFQLGAGGSFHDARRRASGSRRAHRRTLAASVHDGDVPILLRGVLGRHSIAALLEARVVAPLIIPFSEIARQLHRLGGLRNAGIAARARVERIASSQDEGAREES